MSRIISSIAMALTLLLGGASGLEPPGGCAIRGAPEGKKSQKNIPKNRPQHTDSLTEPMI